MERSPGARALSCLASVVMLVVATAALGPVWTAGASAADAAAAHPVRVRVEPAVNALGGRAMAPGDVLYRPVAVHNDGAAPFAYRLAVVSADPEAPLAGLLRFEVRATAACDAAAFAAGPVVAGPATVRSFAPSAARLLGAGAAEHLCVRIALPRSLPAALHGAAVEAVLRVTATQT